MFKNARRRRRALDWSRFFNEQMHKLILIDKRYENNVDKNDASVG